MSETQAVVQNKSELQSGEKKVSEWKRFLLMAFIGLPIVSALLLCAYGFLVWFGQMWIWGPPGP